MPDSIRPAANRLCTSLRVLALAPLVALTAAEVFAAGSAAAAPAGTPAGASAFVQIANGGDHSCALDAAGDVYCWGRGLEGQLGNGRYQDSPSPLRVDGLGGTATAVSAGGTHSCALRSDGAVLCWGAAAVATGGATPQPVAGVANATRIASGTSTACARVPSGSGAGAVCWGGAPLGDGTSTPRSNAAPVSDLEDAVHDVAVGHQHACAALDGGRVKCWGSNTFRQLGDGTTTTRLTPVDVQGLSEPIAKLALGNVFSCGLSTTGRVSCWGMNSSGQLGTGDLLTRPGPDFTVGLSEPVSDISSASFSTCAVGADGGVRCWGSATSETLDGAHGFMGITPVPLPVAGLQGTALAIAASRIGQTFSSHYCALLDDGSAHCWGANFHGKLGRGARPYRAMATDVANAPNAAIALSVAERHACQADADGGIWCWGNNRGGEIGAADLRGSTSARSIDDASLHAFELGVGESHSCALGVDASVWCFGRNAFGRLGVGSTSPVNSAQPLQAVGLEGVTDSLGVGRFHSCATRNDGAVLCWGSNVDGALGSGSSSPTSNATPAAVVGLPAPALQVASGELSSCAVLSDGSVWCWGRGVEGQLGNGALLSSTSPVQVAGLAEAAVGIAAGNWHYCAVLATGGVSCWGWNGWGQLGVDPFTVDVFQSTPLPISGLAEAVDSLSASSFATCARTVTGSLWCWGGNERGALGLGPGTSYSAAPVRIRGIGAEAVAKVDLGEAHACAAMNEGGTRCWGANDSGQLGDGSDFYAPTPVTMPQADVRTATGDFPAQLRPGQTFGFWFGVRNDGPAEALGVRLVTSALGGVSTLAWTCTSEQGLCETESGEGPFDSTIDIPLGGHLRLDLSAQALVEASGEAFARFRSLVPGATFDPDPANNTAEFASALVNAAPVAQDDAYATRPALSLESAAPGVLANDVDADGDDLAAVLIPGSGPFHGSLALGPDGSFSYQPDPGFVGTDSFTYFAQDPFGANSDSESASVMIAVANLAPTALNDAYATRPGLRLDVAPSGVLENDTDPDGDDMVAVLVAESGPFHGSLMLESDGGFTYQPDPGFVGTDIFAYIAQDPFGANSDSAPASVSIEVGNLAPLAQDDAFVALANSSLSVAAPGVLANDSDPEGDALSAQLLEGHGPAHGSLSLASDGGFDYTPSPGFVGSDSFEYFVIDAFGAQSGVARVDISVVPEPVDLALGVDRIVLQPGATTPGVAELSVRNLGETDSLGFHLDLEAEPGVQASAFALLQCEPVPNEDGSVGVRCSSPPELDCQALGEGGLRCLLPGLPGGAERGFWFALQGAGAEGLAARARIVVTGDSEPGNDAVDVVFGNGNGGGEP